jgi:hypothetical protein
MTDAYLDGLLDELVTAEPRERWNDVLGRARRSRRRYIAVVAAIGTLVLVPATWAAVSAFEGTPAPRSIQQNFVEWNASAVQLSQSGFRKAVPHADASKAHGVLQLQTNDGPLDLWAAPELNGNGRCWFVGWDSELNGPNGPRGVNSCTQTDAQPFNWMGWNDANHPSYTVLIGSVNGSETTLDVTLADGSTTTLPVVEHLFLGALPHGSKVQTILGRDAAGNVVATWPQSSG